RQAGWFRIASVGDPHLTRSGIACGGQELKWWTFAWDKTGPATQSACVSADCRSGWQEKQSKHRSNFYRRRSAWSAGNRRKKEEPVGRYWRDRIPPFTPRIYPKFFPSVYPKRELSQSVTVYQLVV